MLEKEKRLELL